MTGPFGFPLYVLSDGEPVSDGWPDLPDHAAAFCEMLAEAIKDVECGLSVNEVAARLVNPIRIGAHRI